MSESIYKVPVRTFIRTEREEVKTELETRNTMHTMHEFLTAATDTYYRFLKGELVEKEAQVSTSEVYSADMKKELQAVVNNMDYTPQLEEIQERLEQQSSIIKSQSEIIRNQRENLSALIQLVPALQDLILKLSSEGKIHASEIAATKIPATPTTTTSSSINNRYTNYNAFDDTKKEKQTEELAHKILHVGIRNVEEDSKGNEKESYLPEDAIIVDGEDLTKDVNIQIEKASNADINKFWQ